MGRGQKRQWGGGGRGGGRDGNTWSQDKRHKGPKDFLGKDDMRNVAFEEYYKAQGVVPEGEWEAFMACLRSPLPVTFRINGSGSFADHLRDKLQSDFFAKFSKERLTVDGEPVNPPKQLAWYPNGYAWQLEFSRNMLRKLPLLESIHSFIKHANEAGSISRQEAVSMVPPLFLDVQPHHKVLDMCAAPGSKTFQLLEALHAGSAAGSVPDGLVVANDADFNRCNLLTHQTKRVCSPCLMVVNHSAERLPVQLAGFAAGVKKQKQQQGDAAAAADGAAAGGDAGAAAADGAAADAKNGRANVRFDRILADVPCSGDGTLRKSPDIWRRWNVAGGNSLHPLQLKIALHGARLLEVGGRMVYSTCTFNPVEDEAVVAELLHRCGGALELVDVGGELPGLRRLPGVHSWKVRDRFRFYGSWQEAKGVCYKLHPTMFPSEEKAKMPLERCMRFLPHHGDTGGFFVAVLRKVAELPTQGEAAEKLEVVEGAEDVEAPEGEEEAGGDGEEGPGEGGAEPMEAEAEAPAAPLEAARGAAEAAVEAAEAALAAYEANEYDNAARALANAEASARRAGAAAKRQPGKSSKATAERPARPEFDPRQRQGEQAAGAQPEGGAGEAGTSAPVPLSWIRGGGGRGRPDGHGRFVYLDPVMPVEDPAILSSLYDYYGLPPDLPLRSQLLTRSMEGRPKRLYFVGRSILDLLLADGKEQMKIVATGLKVFERQEIKDAQNDCPYRLAQEGLPLVLPHITRQRVCVPPELLLQLLKERSLVFPEAAEAVAGEVTAQGNPKGVKPVLSDPGLLAALEPLKFGCVVAELSAEDAKRLGFAPPAHHQAAEAAGEAVTGGLTANAPLAVVAWKGKVSLAIMVEKAECAQMVDKLEEELRKLKAGEGAEAQAAS